MEFARLLAHLSCENKEFSRIVAKRAIIGLNKASGDETATYIRVISQLLFVPDSLRGQRLEWILGIPQARLERPIIYSQQSMPPPKMGVDTLRGPNDDICEYRSTLFKTSGQIKESYLQLLFQYRNKWPKFVLEGVLGLLQACSLDGTGVIFYYVYTMDPPTYQYARYLDWVKPFILDQIEHNLRNSSIQAY